MPDHVQGGAGALDRSTTSRGQNPQYDAGNLTHAHGGRSHQPQRELRQRMQDEPSRANAEDERHAL